MGSDESSFIYSIDLTLSSISSMPIILALSARIGCGVSWVILIIFVSDSSNAMLLLGGWVLQAQNRIEVKTATVNCLIFECQSPL